MIDLVVRVLIPAVLICGAAVALEYGTTDTDDKLIGAGLALLVLAALLIFGGRA